ncbi:TetR/AcrR family transcriptional regulator [Andreprevotia chitinilytica]|uniref:TetR/AcrR family transcriptional regulator n=1 Tax=Andreprevotia chitinilytica TaxID=396808 RepID=UPI00054CFB20|nr:TetR/AcrR family transcriptional regulator [Andreprevotia chitinilytica]
MLKETESSTREQIVRVAMDLIQTRSYLGFSFQDIADRVGIRKASLYHHFASKESLGVEVLQTAMQGFNDWTATTPKSPQKKLDAYFSLYRKELRAGQAVCPAGAFAPGWDCANDDLRAAASELRNTQIQWLTEVLGGMDLKQPAGSLDQLAVFVFAVCQGALTSARMTENVAEFDITIAQLKTLLAR